jgi:hypothetical protein
LFERFSWRLEEENKIQRFKYLMENDFTESFFKKFGSQDHSPNEEYILYFGMNAITEYIESFKQSGVISADDCDEGCTTLLNNIFLNINVLERRKELKALDPLKGEEVGFANTLEKNLEKILHLEENLLQFIYVNDREFELLLVFVGRRLKDAVNAHVDKKSKDNIIGFNNHFIKLHNAFMKDNKTEMKDILQGLKDHWIFGSKIDYVVNILEQDSELKGMSPGLDIHELSKQENILLKLEKLFKSQIKLSTFYQQLQAFKEKINQPMLNILNLVRAILLDKNTENIKASQFPGSVYNSKVEPIQVGQNINEGFDSVYKELKSINKILVELDANAYQKNESLKELKKIIPIFAHSAKTIQPIINFSDTSRSNSFAYLKNNIMIFKKQITPIYKKIETRSHGNPESLLTKQSQYFIQKYSHIKQEVIAHLKSMTLLRGDILKGVGEYENQISDNVWNKERNERIAKYEKIYDLQLFYKKLVSLYEIELRQNFVKSLNLIKPNLSKLDYLTVAIRDIGTIVKYLRGKKYTDNDAIEKLAKTYGADLKFINIEYETELTDLLLKTLEQLGKLYETNLKLTTGDFYLKKMSYFNLQGSRSEHPNKFHIEAKMGNTKLTPPLLSFDVEEQKVAKILPTLKQFQLEFLKFRLIFVGESEEVFLYDIHVPHVNVKKSHFNLLTFHEIELDLESIIKKHPLG